MQATLIYTMSSHCYEGSLFLEQNELDGLSCFGSFQHIFIDDSIKIRSRYRPAC